MHFVSSNSAAQSEWVILNNSFWPDIDLRDYFADINQDSDIAPDIIRRLVMLAISEINAELSEWRQWQEIDGFNHLNEVPARMIAGISEKIYYYHNAIAAWARMLYEQEYATVTHHQFNQLKSDFRHHSASARVNIIRTSLYRIIESK